MSAPAPWVPTQLGRYVLENEVGRGVMGVVYRARDPVLDRIVALKTINAGSLLPEADRIGFEERFLLEARAAASLSHPTIVVVHDVGRDPSTGILYIAFEYLAGETVARRLADGAALEWREATRIAARVALGLQHAHARGVVHRDVKPANVMILPSGEVKILDFGVARFRMESLTGLGHSYGTPLYMPPEQILGAPGDARGDVFSLGAVLYRMLTGREAFEAPNLYAILQRVAKDEPLAPSRCVSGLPEALDTVVARAMAKNPAARYPDAASLARDLLRVREQGAAAGVESSRTGAATPLPARPRRRRGDPRPARPWLAVGLVALVAALGASFLGRGHGHEAPTPAPATHSAVTQRPEPTTTLASRAVIEIVLRHSVSAGRLSVWMSGRTVFKGNLSRDGLTRGRIEAPPGWVRMRIRVDSGGDTWIARTEGIVDAGASYRVEVVQSGIPGDQRASLVVEPIFAGPS